MTIQPIDKPRCQCLDLNNIHPECRHDADYVVTYDDGTKLLMCDIHASARFGTDKLLYGE